MGVMETSLRSRGAGRGGGAKQELLGAPGGPALMDGADKLGSVLAARGGGTAGGVGLVLGGGASTAIRAAGGGASRLQVQLCQVPAVRGRSQL